MRKLNLKKITVTVIHAFILWILCGATMIIGRSVMSLQSALIIHAIGAPVFAALVSLVYYKNFAYTTPLETSFIFLFFVIAMDAGLVAPVFEKSYEMFRSILGTWIPFVLIFLTTLITGLLLKRKAFSAHPSPQSLRS